MRLISLTSAVAALLSAAPALAVDWAKVPGREVVLLYPGQTSWEWNLTEADHSAAAKFKAGQNCIECHKNQEKTQGALMVSGKKAEPNAIASFPGHVVVNTRFAYDDQRLYARFEFKEPASPNTKMDAEFATKLAFIFNDAAVPEGVRAGCWASCHEDNASMPAAGGSERTKYLMKSRAKLSRQGGGDLLKIPRGPGQADRDRLHPGMVAGQAESRRQAGGRRRHHLRPPPGTEARPGQRRSDPGR
ncbi:ethylbenzene dehydrogenase-related protein [Paramagnetospirillum magneticum]|nr:ethylbenzene dehydrogenase-related protein [Paramagnetospirillum magneticum]